MIGATDIRVRLGKAWIQAGREIERLTYRAKIAQPRLLGPAIRGPLVQLYRADAAFDTEVSFINYLSFYLLDEDLAITVTVTAYDRGGRKLGSGRHRIGHHRQVMGIEVGDQAGPASSRAFDRGRMGGGLDRERRPDLVAWRVRRVEQLDLARVVHKPDRGRLFVIAATRRQSRGDGGQEQRLARNANRIARHGKLPLEGTEQSTIIT